MAENDAVEIPAEDFIDRAACAFPVAEEGAKTAADARSAMDAGGPEVCAGRPMYRCLEVLDCVGDDVADRPDVIDLGLQVRREADG